MLMTYCSKLETKSRGSAPNPDRELAPRILFNKKLKRGTGTDSPAKPQGLSIAMLIFHGIIRILLIVINIKRKEYFNPRFTNPNFRALRIYPSV
jgi:hypothetical protein